MKLFIKRKQAKGMLEGVRFESRANSELRKNKRALRSYRICCRVASFFALLFLTIVVSGCGWIQVAKLLPRDGEAGDQFGRSVSMGHPNWVIVGAMFDDDNYHDSGSAQIYSNYGSGWMLHPMEPAPPESEGRLFGTSVSMNNYERVVVGAIGNSAAYSYRFQGPAPWFFADSLEVEYPPSDSAPLGDSVSVSAIEAAPDDIGTAIVGASFDDVYGSNSGSAYVFIEPEPAYGTEWEQWGERLQPDDGATGDWFGASVSLSGSTAIVGAFHDDDNGHDSGSAYIFHIIEEPPPGYTQVAKLWPLDGAEEDYFGYSVSIDGDTAIVGAPWDDDNGDNSGSAYIFQNGDSGWEQVAKLLPRDSEAGDEFGVSVSISGDFAIIGARYDDDNGNNSGSAYVFQNSDSGWEQVSKLLASDGEAGDEFGVSVSIRSTNAIVGAPRDDDNGLDSGSAYIFTKIDK